MKIKKIAIGIKGLKESLEDFAATWKKIEAGQEIKKKRGSILNP